MRLDMWRTSDKDRRGPAPKPIPRPSTRSGVEVDVSPAVAIRLLQSVAPVSAN